MSEQQKAPSKEEVIAFLSEQIEVKTVQLQLQELNTKLAVARAEELKALSFIGQVTNPQPTQTVSHVVTQEDIDNNPELKEAGIEVGQEIQIPKDMIEQVQQEEVKTKKNLKK